MEVQKDGDVEKQAVNAARDARNGCRILQTLSFDTRNLILIAFGEALQAGKNQEKILEENQKDLVYMM